VSQFA
jgi:hypothetical protein